MRSAMPSTRAASCSSSVRTRARLPSGTSAGSLTDPFSPREAHINTTRAPASDSRASVPPQASDSSSGCAKTASTVRPASERESSATMRLHESTVHVDVLVHHACGAEPRHGAIVHARAIEIEHTLQLVHHLLQVFEHDAGDAIVDDLADG